MLRSPSLLSNSYKRLTKRSKKTPATKNNLKQLRTIFQTHNCLVPNSDLSLQLFQKQKQHRSNLELCENIKKWYLDEIKVRIENGVYQESFYECFDEKYVVAPFGSQATFLSQDTSDLDLCIAGLVPSVELDLGIAKVFGIDFNDNFPIEVGNCKGNFSGRFSLKQVTGKLRQNRDGISKSNGNMKKSGNLVTPTNKFDIVYSNHAYQVFNSQYILDVVQTDYDVYRFLSLVKSVHKLGDFKGMDKFTSYCTSILAIVFLQNNGYLPKLPDLQDDFKVPDFDGISPEVLKIMYRFEDIEKLDINTISSEFSTDPNATQKSGTRITSTDLMSEHVLFSSDYNKKSVKLLEPIENVSNLVYEFCLFLQNFGKNPAIVDGRTANIFSGEDRYEKFREFYLENYGLLPDISYMGTDERTLRNSIVAVIDPFEMTHNLCRRQLKEVVYGKSYWLKWEGVSEGLRCSLERDG